MAAPRFAAIISALICLTVCATTPARAATQILATDTVATVDGYNGTGDSVAPITLAGTAKPFTRALRVLRKSTGEFSYNAALIWRNVAPIKKGDLLVAQFYVRRADAVSQLLNLDITFQMNDAPFTADLNAAAPVGVKEFRKFGLPFRANRNYAIGEASLQIRYGLLQQSFDVGGVAVVNHGQIATAIPQSIRATFANDYPGRGNANAAWRKTASQNIERYRKGNMVVRVVDSAGKPVSGAAVKIEQTASSFIWGTAASAISLTCNAGLAGDTSRACPTTDQLGDKPVTPADYRKLRSELLKNFNGSSFYNDLKWTDFRADRQVALDGVAWMKRKGLQLWRGHNLIWPSYTPDYLMPVEVINASIPPDQARAAIADHFADILGTLKGQIPEWDVVNEPYANYDVQGRIASPGVAAVSGKLPTSALADWFKDARRLDPKAKLFLNDYAIFDTVNPTAQLYDLNLVKYAKGLGAPIDGIGFQAHFGSSGPDFAEMQRIINAFSPLVERFSITEFDFTSLDPAFQADLMRDLMTFIYGQPKFNTFQMWGFWDGDHWLGSAPLFNRDWSLKSSGKVWRELTQKTWRTNKSGTSSSVAGELRTRAFYGTYKITVTRGGKSCTITSRFDKPGTITAPATC